ncbi:hypothetical protein ACI8AF_09690 [Blastococcus sp. SYSU D00669]
MPRLLPLAPTRRARRIAVAVSALGALAVAAGLVWQSAYAAFTDSTPARTLTWSTGTVAISDDDAGAVLFSAADLRPGAARSRCITVTSTGSAPSLVRLYGTGRSTTRSLSSHLTVAVEAGTGGSAAGCNGFAPAATVYRGTLAAFPTSYAAGVGSWTTAGNPAGERTTYRFTYSLSASAPASAQGGTAAIAFTWEAQNT